MSKFRIGEICYFIISNRYIEKGVIVTIDSDFYIVKYGEDKGIRLRGSRLYKTKEEADIYINQRMKPYNQYYEKIR